METLKYAVFRIGTFLYGLTYKMCHGMTEQSSSINLPTNSKQDVEVISKDDVDKIRNYVRSSTPFILKNMSDKYDRVDISRYNVKQNEMIVEVHLFNDPLNNSVRHDAEKYTSIGGPLSGKLVSRIDIMRRYKAGIAHCDVLPTTNYYWMQQGRKLVQIVPKEYSMLLPTLFGHDNCYVKEDFDNPESQEWLKKLPGYWEVLLEEGDVLVFNNGGCIHRFENIEDIPTVSQSYRTINFHFAHSPLVNELMYGGTTNASIYKSMKEKLMYRDQHTM